MAGLFILKKPMKIKEFRNKLGKNISSLKIGANRDKQRKTQRESPMTQLQIFRKKKLKICL
tara:strand:+ start:658 stop:840 length:183 start_codon:yes stop_codon:yes gene_type:complete